MFFLTLPGERAAVVYKLNSHSRTLEPLPSGKQIARASGTNFSGQRLVVSPLQRVGRLLRRRTAVLCCPEWHFQVAGDKLLEAEDRLSWGPGHKGSTRTLLKYLLTVPTAWLPGQTAGHTLALAPQGREQWI